MGHYVYFVRHASRDRTIKNETAPLSKKGQREAERLAYLLSQYDVEAVYSSPYERTVDTVKPFAQLCQIEIQMLEGLRERNIGKWVDDFDAFARHQWSDFNHKLVGGESLNDVRTRILPSFHHLLTKEKDRNIVVSSHGTALAVLFHALTDGEFDYENFKEMSMPDLYVYDVGLKVLTRQHLNGMIDES